MNKKKRIAVIAALCVMVVMAIVVSLLLNRRSYTVLYRGLSSSEGAEVLDVLDGLGAQYKIDKDGTIYVLSKDEAVLKMKLAAEGYPKSSLSYDIFTSTSDLMTTDYEKRQYLVFQLQNRLQDAIKTLSGVKSAIVTLNVADDSSFVLKSDETESTASVVLDLYSTTELTKQQIKGIEELVAKSVSGLDPKNVVIIDGDGEILNNSDSDDGIGETYTQLELVNSINSLYENKINALLEPVLGKNGLSVSVNVVVDFTRKTSEETSYTPSVGNSGVVSHHEYDNESTNGGTVASGVTGTESNTGTTTYEQGTNTGSNQSASASGSTDYLVNQVIRTISDNGGTIKDMTVAVMINKSELSQETMEQYRKLIAYGTGISDDKVAISYAEFIKNDSGKTGTETGESNVIKALADMLGIAEPIIYAGLAGVGLLVIIIVSIVLRVSIKKKRKRRALEIKKAASEKPPVQKAEVPEIVLNETREQVLKKQIKDFSDSNPEIVAQLLRSWMKEDGTK